MITPLKISLVIFLLHISCISFSQIVKPPVPDTSIAVAPKADTIKEFEIIRGPSMRSIYIDSSTTLQTIAGGAIVKQGSVIISGDSIAINPTTHVVEVFNNVHINQADTIQTYAHYLKYIGSEKTAYLQKDVKLIDKKTTLFTQNLDYNLKSGIGNYHNGGKVVNEKTTITSKDGTYYADTKDIYFKNDVVVNQPKNYVTTDSLLYNTVTQNYNLNGDTYINNNGTEIYTNQGSYNLNSDNAVFTTRTTVKDSSGRVYVANNMAMDNKSGSAQMEGNAIIKDSAGGFIVLANQVFLNKKINSFLATRKPILIIKQKDDSIYVAADTIFSGYSTAVKNEEFVLRKDSVIHGVLPQQTPADSAMKNDTLHFEKNYSTRDSAIHLAHIIDSLTTNNHNEQPEKIEKTKENPVLNDSLKTIFSHADSLNIDSVKAKQKYEDSLKNLRTKSTPAMGDSLKAIALQRDSLKIDSAITKRNRNDSLQINLNDTTNKKDSSRYFLAFHHVRIFSDSLQSVCDSLFFSAKDSVFRLYYDPVIWSGHSQITGDTIFLYTKNKKPERMYAFDKGTIINKTTEGFYNQIAGKTINGYFNDGAIDYMRVKGSQAESIYYPQDKDSAYMGMNRATGDVIDLYFKKDELEKVLFVNDIQGKFYPMKDIPADQKYLKDFIWLDEKRPKNKLELFE